VSNLSVGSVGFYALCDSSISNMLASSYLMDIRVSGFSSVFDTKKLVDDSTAMVMRFEKGLPYAIIGALTGLETGF